MDASNTQQATAATVTVYEFETYDPRRRLWVKAAELGTLDAIARLGGVPLKATSMVVDADKVRADGLLTPSPRSDDGG